MCIRTSLAGKTHLQWKYYLVSIVCLSSIYRKQQGYAIQIGLQRIVEFRGKRKNIQYEKNKAKTTTVRRKIRCLCYVRAIVAVDANCEHGRL